MIGPYVGSALAMRAAGAGGSSDIGDANVWQSASTGTAGIAAARTAAGADLADGDVLRDSDGASWRVVDSGGNRYYLREQLPLNTPTVTTAWTGVDPVAEGITGWDKNNGANGSYTVTDGVLTVASDGSGNTGRINYDDGVSRLAGPSAFIVEDLSAAAAGALQTNWPLFQLRSVDGPSLQFRPQGNGAGDPWGIALFGSDYSLSGTAIGTPTRISGWWDPTQTPTPIVIAMGGGDVIVAVLTLPTITVGTASVVGLAPYSTADQSISAASFALMEES